jgi:dTDP-4-dehydrorhamnose reductase
MDPKGPKNIYGQSKLQGEMAVSSQMTAYFIVRTSWVYGVNGNNFVKTMLRLGKERDSINVVCDQIGSPTYSYDLARCLVDLIQTTRYGVYHATNEGFCSWAEFAQAIMDKAGLNCKVHPVLTIQYKTAAARPLNSRMSKDSLDRAGIARLPQWEDALERYLMELR